MKKLLLILSLYIACLQPLQAKEEIISFRLSSLNGLPDNSVRYMQQAPSGELLLMMHYTAYSYDGYSFRQLTDEEFQQLHTASQADHSISESYDRDNQGNHVTMETDALVYTDQQTGQQLRLPVINPQWRKLTQNLKCRVVTDHKGRIWVSLNGFGLYVYNRQTQQLRHIEKGDGSGLLDTNALVYMMLDRDDNIWVAEDHYGLVCLKTVEQNYETIYPTERALSGRSAEIRMMSRLTDGRIIVANNAGQVFEADGALQNFNLLPTDGENYISAGLDTLGRLWLGSRINGVNVGGRHYGSGRTDYLLTDRKGRMWSCGLKNPVKLMALSPDGSYTEKTFFDDVDNLQPRMMAEDDKGNIYVAAEKGLFRFNPDQLINDRKAYSRLTEEPLRCLLIDSSGQLWMGTLTGGVLRADLKKGMPLKTKRITRNDGLAGNIIQTIAEDGRHRICVATQTGCSLIDPQTGHIRSLYMTDFQLRNYYEENSAALLTGGLLALGTLDGIVALRNDGTTEPKTLHPVVVTAIYAGGEKSALAADGNWQGSHTENSLTLHVSNFNFTNQQQTDYTFMLEGYDRAWSEPSHLNQTSYKHLPPGKYTLHVRAREAGGDWEPETTMQITILPPWWRTWWAYLIYMALAFVAGYTLYRHLRYLLRLRQSIAVEKQLTEYKLKFFTNISHEFRTPLTLIQGSMDKLRQLPDAPASARQPLSSMQRNVDRLLRLINQLLEFRRMQNNRLQLALEETDIVSFCHNLYQTFHDTAEQQKIALSFVPTVKSQTMYIDRGFIDKAVYNLLSNAFKYTPQHGSVTLRVAPGEETCLLQVIDTGVGVPADQREAIFDRFQRGQIGRDSLGIGLDLTAELIRTHHGTISCSGNEPQGSIFTISLPMSKDVYQPTDFATVTTSQADSDDERQGFSVAVAEALPEPMNDHRVLVVEDDADIQAYLRQELGRYFTVETAGNGEEALERLKNETVQLIITDVMMPRMNGYELLRRLRQNQQTRHLPVIMLTALDSEDQQLKGLDAGADAYIAKPFSLQLLLLQCRNLLQRGDRMKDAYAQTEKAARQVSPAIITEENDRRLLAQLSVWVDSHLASPDLSVDRFAEEMGYGRTTFYAKLKTLTGQTPNDYIKERRLERAAELLKDDRVTVAEVAYQVGMSTPQYLSTTFKKHYGVTPSQYQKGQH